MVTILDYRVKNGENQVMDIKFTVWKKNQSFFDFSFVIVFLVSELISFFTRSDKEMIAEEFNNQ